MERSGARERTPRVVGELGADSVLLLRSTSLRLLAAAEDSRRERFEGGGVTSSLLNSSSVVITSLSVIDISCVVIGGVVRAASSSSPSTNVCLLAANALLRSFSCSLCFCCSLRKRRSRSASTIGAISLARRKSASESCSSRRPPPLSSPAPVGFCRPSSSVLVLGVSVGRALRSAVGLKGSFFWIAVRSAMVQVVAMLVQVKAMNKAGRK